MSEHMVMRLQGGVETGQTCKHDMQGSEDGEH